MGRCGGSVRGLLSVVGLQAHCAVVARRAGLAVSNKQVYRIFKAAGLLQKPRVREAAIYQTARLFELLPSAPNELWQSDVTYLHIPGHGWWYAVTVIDYYSLSARLPPAEVRTIGRASCANSATPSS